MASFHENIHRHMHRHSFESTGSDHPGTWASDCRKQASTSWAASARSVFRPTPTTEVQMVATCPNSTSYWHGVIECHLQMNNVHFALCRRALPSSRPEVKSVAPDGWLARLYSARTSRIVPLLPDEHNVVLATDPASRRPHYRAATVQNNLALVAPTRDEVVVGRQGHATDRRRVARQPCDLRLRTAHVPYAHGGVVRARVALIEQVDSGHSVAASPSHLGRPATCKLS